MWMNRLNRLLLFMPSRVLRQESLRCYSQHLLTIFLRARATPPPLPPFPRKKHRRGLPPVHPKPLAVHSRRLPVHPRRWLVHPNLNPTTFEVLGEFRWHLRSKHRDPRGWSGDTWAEYLLRRLEEGGVTGRRRWRWRSLICTLP